MLILHHDLKQEKDHEGIRKNFQKVKKEIIRNITDKGEHNGDTNLIYDFKILNSVVGMLLRARKHGFLDFEGEMLWQRQDDDVRIYLLVDLDDAKEKLGV